MLYLHIYVLADAMHTQLQAAMQALPRALSAHTESHACTEDTSEDPVRQCACMLLAPSACMYLPGPRMHAQISQQQAEVQRISQEAQEADDLSAQAMQSAESAVQEEMEALAVSQGIQEAFSKALVDLHDLGESFKANALRSTEEQEKRHKRTLVGIHG